MGVEADRLGGERADLAAQRGRVAFAVGMHAIAEEDHETLRGRVDPDAGAGPAGVTKRGARGEPPAARTGEAGVDVPAEPATVGTVVLHARHRSDTRGIQNAHAVEFTAADQHPGEAGEVGGGGEEPGVTGDAAHPAGGRIVHDAVDHPTVDQLGGGNAGKLFLRRQESGVGQLEGAEDFLLAIDVERATADEADEFAEHDVVDIAIHERALRHAAELFRAGAFDGAGVAVPGGSGGDARPETRHVDHEVPDLDDVLPVLAEGRKVTGDGRFEIELAALDELHRRGGGRDDLGQGGGVVDRVLGGGVGGRHQRALPVNLAIGLPRALEPEHPAGHLLRGDRVGDGPVDGGEFVRLERRRRGGAG